MNLIPGSILQDRYRIDGIIGKGGMGAVYKGYDNSLAIPVAIKENLNPLPQAVRQFKREAVMLASLRHPNLPRVTDHFIVGDLQYLIMDYIEGEDLKTILEREGAQPETRIAGWLHEIAGALSYLHQQSPPIVHRDVKPANIKITPDGKPVLVDFGIAKVAESGHLTTTGARSLTPGFAPPEQYGSGQTNARSDQYSLAATIFTLLTGQIPPDSIERTLGQAALTPPRELNPQISPWLERALLKAMALTPSDRFANIQEFLDAAEGRTPESTVVLPPPEPKTIARATADPTIQAPPVAAPAPHATPSLWLVAAAVIGCLVLVSLTIGAFAARGMLFPAQPSRTPPPANSVMAAPSEQPAATKNKLSPTQTPAPTAQPISTTQAGPAILPTGVGGGRLLAFTSNRGADHRYQIYTMDGATGEAKQITSGPFDAGRSAWSPDGKGLYYESQSKSNNGHWSIFYIDITQPNAAPKSITNNPADDAHPDDTHPAVSPFDGKLAFVSTRNTGQQAIWWMNQDGSFDNVSAKHTGYSFRQPSEWDPAWSPNGSSLFLVLAATGPVRIFQWDLYSADPLGVTMNNYGQDYREGEPAISPDSSQIAYTRSIKSGGQSQICVAVLDPKKPAACETPLAASDLSSSPDWSPDGLWLAYTARKDGNSEIYRMTISGASRTNLTNNPAEDKYPAWQPGPRPK
jgi:eukaryotic-like serine/threonine-protein kinase